MSSTTPRDIRSTLAPFVAVFVVMLASQAHMQFADTDLWGRLAAAAHWFGTGVFPRTDPFSFVASGREWIDHEWLSGAAFYGCLRVGGELGLIVLKDAVLAACLGLVFLIQRRAYGASLKTAFFTLLLLSPIIDLSFVAVVRCQIFSFLLFLVFLFTLETRRTQSSRGIALASLFPLGIVWANLHGGFAIGLLLLLAYAVGEAVAQRSVRAAVGPSGIIIAILLGAAFINPYGPRYLQFLGMAWSLDRSDVIEWQPLWSRFSWERVEIGALVILSVGLAIRALVAARGDRRAPASPAILLLGLTAMTLHSYRFKTFLAFGGAALGPALIPEDVFAQLAKYGGRWVDRVVLMVAALSLIALGSEGSHPGVAPLPRQIYPLREIEFLRRTGATGNLATTFGTGEFAAWALYPKLRVAVDGRFEEVYRLAEVRGWLRFFGAPAQARDGAPAQARDGAPAQARGGERADWAREQGANWAIVPDIAEGTIRSLRDSSEWKLVMDAEAYTLFSDLKQSGVSAPSGIPADETPTIADYFTDSDLARFTEKPPG